MPSSRETIVGVAASIAGALGVAAASRELTDEKKPAAATAPAQPPRAAKIDHQQPPVATESAQPPTPHLINPHVELKPGWSAPQPAEIPRPTFWPAVMSLGIIFILWGVATSYMITGVGLVLFAV